MCDRRIKIVPLGLPTATCSAFRQIRFSVERVDAAHLKRHELNVEREVATGELLKLFDGRTLLRSCIANNSAHI